MVPPTPSSTSTSDDRRGRLGVSTLCISFSRMTPPPSLPESAQYWKHGWELSDRFNIKFGPLDSNAGVFGGAGGGEKDRWAAAKWDHKKDTQVWNI